MIRHDEQFSEVIATDTVGRQFTRRTVKRIRSRHGDEFEVGDIEFDPSIPKHRDRALAVLKLAGIDVDAEMGACPTVSSFWNLLSDREDSDSFLGLHARMCDACNELLYLLSKDAPVSMLVPRSIKLGRLIMLAHASSLGNSQRKSARKEGPRPNARTVDHGEIAREFKRLTRENHTEGEARGMLTARGLASKSTIYRITKKVS